MEVEDSYMYGEGPEGARRRRHTLTRGRTGRGCGGGRGVFPWISLWFGRLDAYVARFPVGTPPSPSGRGGERGRRIALG